MKLVVTTTTIEVCLAHAATALTEAVGIALELERFNLASRLVHLCSEVKAAKQTKEKSET